MNAFVRTSPAGHTGSVTFALLILTAASAFCDVTPNRKLPKVDPPKAGLDFSATPTTQEFFRARVFEEPLVPVGGEPTPAENTSLAVALRGYAERTSPDDFSSLTDFLKAHPKSVWNAALLTDLGLEYYSTAHYSLALDAWERAWKLAKNTTDLHGKAIADRAVGELAYMYGRLGRMKELDLLLQSIDGRVLGGPATEKISGARQGLSNMQDRPEIAFRCGPLALHRIKVSIDPKNAGDDIIFKSASTTNGFSLPQVAALSQKVGLNYQMARREKGADFIAPSVVHWKVGHYAAIIRKVGDQYLVQDPTFWNDVWVTKEALESETSGFFLVPPGKLPLGWKTAETMEARTIWGKGNTTSNEEGKTTPCDPHTQAGQSCGSEDEDCQGMAVSSVFLMPVSLNIKDQPVGYSPPVGPAVKCKVRYNQRESAQPTIFNYSNFGPKWSCDWIARLTEVRFFPLATVLVSGGSSGSGGSSSYSAKSGSSAGNVSYSPQRDSQTQLTRTTNNGFQVLRRDGSKMVFDLPDKTLPLDGNVGTAFIHWYLTAIIDPAGNALVFTYDASFRLIAVTDAIGQVTLLSYENPNDFYKVTKVTDPFGRFATFQYDPSGRLTKITDVIGLASQFNYEASSDFINALITPYGTNTFTKSENGTTRTLETVYPDGDRDRVEYNQGINLYGSDAAGSVPQGMNTQNQYLQFRNTYYWSKIACAGGYGDYSKAKVYHWLHTADFASTAGILESTKEALEGRVWRDYAGQSSPIVVGTTSKPSHIGRVLDDGSTQLYTYEYNDFGSVTKTIDPVGRTFSYLYASNQIDLLEVRQTRAGNELLSQTVYNAQHLPLTMRDAAGQITTNTYNARGQVLTTTNPRGAVTTNNYATDGYLTSVDGPLPGTGDTTSWTYDSYGRIRTKTDVSGYILTFDYDALDHLTKITFPDGTSDQYTYTLLDHTQVRDRAGRITTFEYNGVRQMTKRTDPLNRTTLFQWCKCGDSKSITDPMGRTTTWNHDVQGRMIAKVYVDGSKISYLHDNAGRVRERIDEKGQVTQYAYNRDNSLASTAYPNAIIATPSVAFTYDPNYNRVATMTDGTGLTRYEYYPINATPALGAGQLASEDAPLPNDTITYEYDPNGRRIFTAIDGVASRLTLDITGRIIGETNALGAFSYVYDGSSFRRVTESFPNGLTTDYTYGNNLLDLSLQRITHKVGVTPISEFIYGRDVAAGRITTWSQKAGVETPSIYNFGYDNANQLASAVVTQGGVTNQTFAYAYDPAANRLWERTMAATNESSHNALNELTTQNGDAVTTLTNQWDAEQRLVSITSGSTNIQFTYDGIGRRVGIRVVTNTIEVSNRKLVWCDSDICEERDTNGLVSKQFFDKGTRVVTGPTTGSYYYTHDHLNSIREMTDGNGNVRARYSYNPFGYQMRVTGDLNSDFGFTGMFWLRDVSFGLTRFRLFDPNTGRWFSRDKLRNAELIEGENLFAYVQNNPVNLTDRLGLCCDKRETQDKANALTALAMVASFACEAAVATATAACLNAKGDGKAKGITCALAAVVAASACAVAAIPVWKADQDLKGCLSDQCPDAPPKDPDGGYAPPFKRPPNPPKDPNCS